MSSDTTHRIREAAPAAAGKARQVASIEFATFKQHEGRQSVLAFWDCSTHPDNGNATTPARIVLSEVAFEDPVWVDMVTGAICELPEDCVVTEGGKTILKDIPVYDAPALITDRSVVVH